MYTLTIRGFPLDFVEKESLKFSTLLRMFMAWKNPQRMKLVRFLYYINWIDLHYHSDVYSSPKADIKDNLHAVFIL